MFTPHILKMDSFFQVPPTQNTPYHQLIFEQNDNGSGWQVRLMSGTTWGREHGTRLKILSAANLKAAEEIYSKKSLELNDAGWKTYNPYASW